MNRKGKCEIIVAEEKLKLMKGVLIRKEKIPGNVMTEMMMWK